MYYCGDLASISSLETEKVKKKIYFFFWKKNKNNKQMYNQQFCRHSRKFDRSSTFSW